MNGDGTRQAGVVNDREESGDDVEQTPMCSSPHHGNSTDVDGSCRRSASDQPTDADDRDDEADGNANWKTFGDILENFAEDTSLLGVPRAILASTRLARLFWVVVCVTCMIMFIEGSTSQLMRYFSYPKQVRSIQHFIYFFAFYFFFVFILFLNFFYSAWAEQWRLQYKVSCRREAVPL